MIDTSDIANGAPEPYDEATILLTEALALVGKDAEETGYPPLVEALLDKIADARDAAEAEADRRRGG